MSKLSIIVAIYNVEKYLDKCLSSLVNQKSDIKYEVLCINDGSTDNSKSIAEKYVNSSNNFILLDKPNGGLSDARNYGLKYASSEYVGFIDGDDFVSDDYVEKVMRHIEQDNLDILVFGYYQYYFFNNTYEQIDLKIKNGIYNLKDNKEILAFTPNAAWNKVYRRSLFVDNSIEYPFGYRHQDLGTTAKLMYHSKRIGYINEPLYHYLIDRPNNITTQIDKNIYHIIDMAKSIMDYYKELNIFDDYIDEFEYLVKRNFIQSLRKAMKMSDKKFVLKFIDNIFDTLDTYFPKKSNEYIIEEEKGDNIYLSRFKCKMYYRIKGVKA